MSPRRRHRNHALPLPALALSVMVSIAGCSSTAPPTRFHSLLPAPDAAPAPVAVAAPGWDGLTVTVPPQVDRPQWVLRQPDDALVLLEDERWAAPLADEIGAAVADRLRRAAPATTLAAGQRPRQIAIDVLRFESAPGRYARVDAEWALRPAPGGGAPWRCRGAFERAAGSSYLLLADAQRANVAALGDAVARSLAAALAGATAPVCAAD